MLMQQATHGKHLSSQVSPDSSKSCCSCSVQSLPAGACSELLAPMTPWLAAPGLNLWLLLLLSGTASSSSCQFEFRELNMNKTLQENGVADETSTFETLGLPSDFHIPVLHVYWNDDLTVA